MFNPIGREAKAATANPLPLLEKLCSSSPDQALVGADKREIGWQRNPDVIALPDLKMEMS